MKYKNLFNSGNIGSISLKNRVIMPSMGTMLSTGDGEISDHQIKYFEERAEGGVGLIITEVTSVEYELGKAGSCHPRVDDNKFIPMLQRLVDTIHKYDTKVFMQLHHAGRESNSMLTGGKQIVAPSPIENFVVGEKPRELSIDEIKDLVQKFTMGALRCKMAGIDGVEIHGAHGYLINQFLSPHSNKRTDEYGGSFENRMRFANEIIQGIKGVCGNDYPVTIRLSVDEFLEDGINLQEGIKIAKHMEEVGADAINVSCGTYETMPTVMEPVTYDEGWRIYMVEAIKKAVDIPVIAVGVIRDPEMAENILKDKKADFIAVGRGNLADPKWTNKAKEGREKEIRKCISCLYCVDGALAGQHIKCAVNTRAGRELEFHNLKKIDKNNKVVIVGGGPSGCEAARVLAERGYDVTLFEKKDRLGGQLNRGNKPKGKYKLNWLVDYYTNELNRLNVEVLISTPATIEKISQYSPDIVIVASGAKTVIPDIKGVNRPNVLTSEDVLSNNNVFTDKKVIVIGGGMTGCETAEWLSNKGNDVTVADQLDELLVGVGIINKMDIMKQLQEAKVNMLPGHVVKEIKDGAVIFQNKKTLEDVTIKADNIILAVGLKADLSLYEQLKDKGYNVEKIGDINGPKNIAKAVHEGFEKAYLMK